MKEKQNKRIVFSGINISVGGPLTMLRHFHQYASEFLAADYEIYFLVKDKQLLPESKLNIIEFPAAQRSLLHKLYYEYVAFKKVSERIQPILWFSLNDITPTVSATIQCVYFHNATPFYKLSWMDLFFPARALVQKFYYYFFYRINLFKNDFVVVQQKFLSDYIIRKLKFPADRILLNRPELNLTSLRKPSPSPAYEATKVFLYPTKAVVYKNVHVIIKAVKLLKSRKVSDFKVVLTIFENDNRYSRYLKYISRNLPEIEFAGYQPFDVLVEQFQRAHCILFPSKLETWGLPLSEAIYFNKHIIAADLQYAHETIGAYAQVDFFNPMSASALAGHMQKFIHQAGPRDSLVTPVEESLHNNLSLDELFKKILQGEA